MKLSALGIPLMLFLTTNVACAESLAWNTNLKAARKEAMLTGKPVLIYAYDSI